MLITHNIHCISKVRLHKQHTESGDTMWYTLYISGNDSTEIEITLFPSNLPQVRENAIQSLDNLKVQTDVQSNL